MHASGAMIRQNHPHDSRKIQIGKALYYRHNGTLFEGVIYALHINSLKKDRTPEGFEGMLRFAPGVSDPKRANAPLHDQFIYRFNHSPDHKVMYAVVQFSEQFIFQLIVLGWDMANRLEESVKVEGGELLYSNRHECRLINKPANA
jgi:hypothetical protein